MNSLKYSYFSQILYFRTLSRYMSNLGSGAGKGGGGGGSIREAGGSFGKMGAAKEEEYFYKQRYKQLAELKENLVGEISFHEEQIKRHQEAIARNQTTVNEMEKQEEQK